MNILDFFWYIIIFIIIITSVYLSKIISYENYKVLFKLKDILKKDKSNLYLSLAAKVGVGSFIGTTMCVLMCGYGVIIWIYIFMFITSSLTYFEAYFGNKYKVKSDGYYITGPYFIMKNGIKNKFLSKAILFIFIISYSIVFIIVQSNTISNIILFTDFLPVILLLIFIILVILSLCLNIKEILSIIDRVIPYMCLLIILLGIISIIKNFNLVGVIILKTLKSSLDIKAMLVGILIGIKRAIFLNELLIGTTSTASKDNNYHLHVIGTYFITFVIMTLIFFIITFYLENSIHDSNYIRVLVNSFNYNYGNLGNIILIILVFLLGLTTILSSSYIAISNIEYVYKNKKYSIILRVVIFISTIFGIFISPKFLWDFSDFLILILIIFNLCSIIYLVRNKKYDRK